MAGGYSTLGLLHLAPARCRFMERHGDLAVGHWLPDDDCRTVDRYRHLAPLTQTGKKFLSLSQKVVSLALCDGNRFRSLRADILFQRNDVTGRSSVLDQQTGIG